MASLLTPWYLEWLKVPQTLLENLVIQMLDWHTLLMEKKETGWDPHQSNQWPTSKDRHIIHVHLHIKELSYSWISLDTWSSNWRWIEWLWPSTILHIRKSHNSKCNQIKLISGLNVQPKVLPWSDTQLYICYKNSLNDVFQAVNLHSVACFH